MAKMNFDEDGLLNEPCLSCEKPYVEDIWHEWCCDEKECPYEKQTKNLDDFINHMFPPVEDKPGYVWINKRNYEMAKRDLIKERLETVYEQYRILQEKLNHNNTKEVRMPLCKGLQADMVIIDEFLEKKGENNAIQSNNS